MTQRKGRHEHAMIDPLSKLGDDLLVDASWADSMDTAVMLRGAACQAAFLSTCLACGMPEKLLEDGILILWGRLSEMRSRAYLTRQDQALGDKWQLEIEERFQVSLKEIENSYDRSPDMEIRRVRDSGVPPHVH